MTDAGMYDHFIIRVREGQPLPGCVQIERVLLAEEVPVGTGTNSERVYTLLVSELASLRQRREAA